MLLFFFCLQKNIAQRDLNLDFEIIARDGNYPVEWKSNGSHIGFLDEKIKKKGQNALRLQLSEEADERNNSYYSQSLILDNKMGKEITFRGYLKTDNIGSAGFFIHAMSGTYFAPVTLLFDKMDGRRLKGTNDWTPVILRIPFMPDIYQVEFGVYLEGKGKVWVDDLKFLIDGKPYELALEKTVTNSNSPKNTTDDKGKPYYQKKAIEEQQKRQADKEKIKNKGL
jgi:erythromycin esterase